MYVERLVDELNSLLDLPKGVNDYQYLKFESITLTTYKNIIREKGRTNYRTIIQASMLLLKDNIDYETVLFDKISTTIASFNPQLNEADCHATKKEIIYYIDYLLIELIKKGFTKLYLHRIISSLFIYQKDAISFAQRFEIFRTLTKKDEEEFMVIFTIPDNSLNFDDLKEINPIYERVTKRFRGRYEKSLSIEVNQFLEKFKATILISVKYCAKDYFKAIQIAVNQLSRDLDIYHIGYHKSDYKIGNNCAVISISSPNKASIQQCDFNIDGFFKSDKVVFATLLTKIKKIKENSSISNSSKEKILSALRYYRTGSESTELETKFLNYWIGLEFIFTSFESDDKTIDRISEYLSICHCLVYVKRNLFDFHKTLKRLKLDANIPSLDENLDYLLNNNQYIDIISSTDYELLKFRTSFFQTWHSDPGKIKQVLLKHEKNLKWNIIRFYRMRNEIVHNAAIKEDIYTHISHLKYYLSFILNSILSFMVDVDTEIESNVTIDDFFISQKIIYGNLQGEKLMDFLKIEDPHSIFQ